MAYCKKGIKPNSINRKGCVKASVMSSYKPFIVRCSIVRSVSQCGADICHVHAGRVTMRPLVEPTDLVFFFILKDDH
ncbi:hypothetical protein JOC94_000101 [Bacillus thermophilus]|uniref:Uncharacterized protein n=1 Tax=Siminovitchia thermophila TaxID=1245522 RepID=A0ABS2R156_9BACI|nr:hypothetical protein [Siminovitchia thermophila]